MGQKVHPNGLRVGVIKDWESKWYADSKNYSDYLVDTEVEHNLYEDLTHKIYLKADYSELH